MVHPLVHLGEINFDEDLLAWIFIEKASTRVIPRKRKEKVSSSFSSRQGYGSLGKLSLMTDDCPPEKTRECNKNPVECNVLLVKILYQSHVKRSLRRYIKLSLNHFHGFFNELSKKIPFSRRTALVKSKTLGLCAFSYSKCIL